MGLNRMMMKNGVILKDIEALMTVDSSGDWLGFMDMYAMGKLTPNPLPNGVRVSFCSISPYDIQLRPAAIKSCTIVGLDMDIKHGGQSSDALVQYMQSHVGKTIPVIFHFE